MADLDRLVLQWGAHDGPENGMCVLEAASQLAGETFGDRPRGVPQVPAAFLRRWNDDLGDVDRQMLKPYAARLVACGGAEPDEAHAWLATDWVVRELTPAFLRLARLEDCASGLERLPPLRDARGAEAARPVLDDVRRRAAESAAGIDAVEPDPPGDVASAATSAVGWATAWEAARAAGWAAAGSAMWAAVDEQAHAGGTAWTAAGDAARIAAWDGARAAARNIAGAAAAAVANDALGDAAWAAARDAVRAALRPSVVVLQQSALRLLDRMLELRPSPT